MVEVARRRCSRPVVEIVIEIGRRVGRRVCFGEGQGRMGYWIGNARSRVGGKD